jgi:hypothetical protein
MRVHFELFQSLGKPWNMLCEEAAAFASKLPPGRLICIAHSEDQDDAVLTVWYWKDSEPATPPVGQTMPVGKTATRKPQRKRRR